METATVGAEGHRYNYLAPRGDKIIGHGVQVLIEGKVVLEEFVPPTVKGTFGKLSPVESDAGDSNPPNKSSRGGKSK